MSKYLNESLTREGVDGLPLFELGGPAPKPPPPVTLTRVVTRPATRTASTFAFVRSLYMKYDSFQKYNNSLQSAICSAPTVSISQLCNSRPSPGGTASPATIWNMKNETFDFIESLGLGQGVAPSSQPLICGIGNLPTYDRGICQDQTAYKHPQGRKQRRRQLRGWPGVRKYFAQSDRFTDSRQTLEVRDQLLQQQVSLSIFFFISIMSENTHSITSISAFSNLAEQNGLLILPSKPPRAAEGSVRGRRLNFPAAIKILKSILEELAPRGPSIVVGLCSWSISVPLIQNLDCFFGCSSKMLSLCRETVEDGRTLARTRQMSAGCGTGKFELSRALSTSMFKTDISGFSVKFPVRQVYTRNQKSTLEYRYCCSSTIKN
ncbi:unnamed protein product, partial [Nesidiocoris tenuis]